MFRAKISIFNMSFDVDHDSSDYFNQTSYEDYNGDGYIDLMFSDGRSEFSSGLPEHSKWSVIYTNSFNGNLKFSDTPQVTTTIAGRGELEDVYNNIDNFKIDKHLFIDVNNDGIKDSLLFKLDENDNKIKVYKTLGTISSGSIESKDKITTITEGFGNQYNIEYKRMSDTSVYTRNNNSVNAWFGSGKTPVFDFNSNMSLVSNHSMSLPAYDNANTNLTGESDKHPDWQQTYDYHYYGAKIQAGGRGFLGFEKFEKTDNNNNIMTQASYHLEFPYTGNAYQTETYLIGANNTATSMRNTGFDPLIPCWVDSSCTAVIPPIDNRLGQGGIDFIIPRSTSSIPTGAQLLSRVFTQWQNKEIIIGNKINKDTHIKSKDPTPL